MLQFASKIIPKSVVKLSCVQMAAKLDFEDPSHVFSWFSDAFASVVSDFVDVFRGLGCICWQFLDLRGAFWGQFLEAFPRVLWCSPQQLFRASRGACATSAVA